MLRYVKGENIVCFPVYNVQLYASFVAIWASILELLFMVGARVRLHHRKTRQLARHDVVKCKAFSFVFLYFKTKCKFLCRAYHKDTTFEWCLEHFPKFFFFLVNKMLVISSISSSLWVHSQPTLGSFMSIKVMISLEMFKMIYLSGVREAVYTQGLIAGVGRKIWGHVARECLKVTR